MRMLVIVLVVILSYLNLSGQNHDLTKEVLLYDSLAIFKTENNYLAYYQTLEKIDDLYRYNKQYDCLKLTDSLYNYYPTSAEERIIFRKYTGYHAYYYERFVQDLNGAKYFYEICRKRLTSPTAFDSKSWSTEKRLATVYAMLDDREKEITLLEELKQFYSSEKDERKVTLIMNDLYDSFMALDKKEIANDILNDGFQLSQNIKYQRSIYAFGAKLMEYYSTLNEDKYQKYKKITQDALSKLKHRKDFNSRKASLFSIVSKHHLKKKELSLALENAKLASKYTFMQFPDNPNRECAKSLNEIARINIIQSDYSQAENTLLSALQILVPSGSFNAKNLSIHIYVENTFIEIIELYATLHLLKNTSKSDDYRLEETVRLIDLGIEVGNQLQEDIVLNKSRLASIGFNRRLINSKVDILHYLLERGRIQKKQFVEALNQSKNILLKEKFDQQKFIRQLSNDTKNSWLSLQKNIQEFISDGYPLGNPDYLKLIEKREVFLDSLSIPKSEVYRDSNTIEFLVTDNALYSTFYTADDTIIQKISNLDSVSYLADQILTNLNELSPSETLKSHLQSLGSMILPTISIDQSSAITFITDGMLNTLPLNLLILDSTYLGITNPIKYSFGIKPDISTGKNQNIYCLEGKYNSNKLYASSDQKSRNEIGPLEFTAFEINNIKSTWQYGKVTHQSAIPFNRAIEEASPYSIFHYSGHADASGDQAKIINGYDGKAEEVLDVQLSEIEHQFDLITMSACETGLGTLELGEGSQSLTRAFLLSGSKSVLSSLWKVDDESTSKVISRFYHHLSNRESKSIALQKAQIDFLKTASPQNRHPYYWAGFILSGSDNPIIQNTNSSRYLYITALPILLLFIYFIKTKQHE